MNNSVAQLFSAFWSGATLALMALTWPLWFVDSSPGSLPTITLFPGGLVTPELSTGVLNASAGLLVISPCRESGRITGPLASPGPLAIPEPSESTSR